MCRLLLANKSGILKLHAALKAYKPEETKTRWYPAVYGRASKYTYGYWDGEVYHWDDYETPTRTYWHEDADSITYPDGIKTLLTYLEMSLGGDGNGLTLIRDRDGNDTTTIKGTEIDNNDLADMLLKEKYKWAVWHTRLRSSGDIRDSNCHPYEIRTRRQRLVLAMNGTEHKFDFGRFWNSRTDAEAIGHIALKLQLKMPYALQHFSSVFVGAYNGKPFAVKNSGALRYFQDHDGIVFASELPRKISETLAFDAIWIDGKVHAPKRQIPTATIAKTPTDLQKQVIEATLENPDMADWTEAEKVLYVTDGITPYMTKPEEKES
jgi:hypothetical protein